MKTMKKLLLVLTIVLMAASAKADEAEDMACESDEDCPEGYGCMMMSCACAPCPEGEECEPCDCPEEGTGWCEYIGDEDWDDYGFYGGECEVDDDCPMGFVCETIMMPCAAPDCPPCACEGCDPDDPDCDPEPCDCPDCPEPEPCDPEEIGMCMYDMVDCETDADCGEGFECLEVEECWGSGGGCLCDCVCEVCVEGEECPECECPPCDCGDEEFEEGCEVVGSFCAPKEQVCETDDDCLEGWECLFMSTGGGGTDCMCEPCEPGEDCPPCDCGDDEPEEWVDEEGYCVPEGWSEIIEEGGMGGANYEATRDAMAGELWGDGSEGGGENDKTVQIADPEAATPGDGDAIEDSSNNCSTSGRAADAAPMMVLFIALAAALLIPRRSRVTSC